MAQRYSEDIFKQIYQDVVEKTKQQQAEITNDDSPEIVAPVVKELVSVNPTRVLPLKFYSLICSDTLF